MELSILHGIQELHNGFLDSVMLFFSSIGNGGMVWIILSLVFLVTKKYRRCGIGMAISLVAMLVIGNIFLKNLIARPRPCWVDQSVTLLIPNPKDYSFPSGHTFAAFAAAFTIFLYHRKEGILALAAAGVIAFSRMYLFVHYPTDILGGMVLGIFISIVVYKLMERFLPYGRKVS